MVMIFQVVEYAMKYVVVVVNGCMCIVCVYDAVMIIDKHLSFLLFSVPHNRSCGRDDFFCFLRYVFGWILVYVQLHGAYASSCSRSSQTSSIVIMIAYCRHCYCHSQAAGIGAAPISLIKGSRRLEDEQRETQVRAS